MSASKKLLIRLSSAGDVLLASPLLKLIKQREPESELHFVVKERYADLIRYNPNISEVHLVQENSNFHQLENLRRELMHRGFDTTLDLHNNFRSIYLRRGTSEDVRVVDKDILKRSILVSTKLNLFSNIRSVALKYAQVYDRSLDKVPAPEIHFGDSVREKVNAYLKDTMTDEKGTICLCPGARHLTKRWPLDYWIDLAKRLAGDSRLVLVGGAEDASTCKQIEMNATCLNFCGKFSLLESAAILSRADLVITNDSFLMHAANAAGRKIVAIFGSSVKEFGFSPYGVENRIMEVDGLRCRPCSHIGKESCPKRHFKCMMETKPIAVYQAVMKLLRD